MDLAMLIQEAAPRVRPFVRETPLEYSRASSRRFGCEVYLKLENFQRTGSFKVRGAANKLLALAPSPQRAGCVAASTGNHGAAVAEICEALQMQCTIFAPRSANPGKVEAMKLAGAAVRLVGNDCSESEQEAREWADRRQLPYISPYNDLQVIAGQGTAGLEICRQLPHPVDAVLVSLGGGGLAAGVAQAIKSCHPGAQVIGCSPENSPVLAASIAAGKILELPTLPTLSDGTAGGLEPGAVTFALCQRLIDHYVAVSEREIARAMRRHLNDHHQLIEGAAAVALAGLEHAAPRLSGKRVAVVLCGANVDPATLQEVLRVTEPD